MVDHDTQLAEGGLEWLRQSPALAGAAGDVREALFKFVLVSARWEGHGVRPARVRGCGRASDFCPARVHACMAMALSLPPTQLYLSQYPPLPPLLPCLAPISSPTRSSSGARCGTR